MPQLPNSCDQFLQYTIATISATKQHIALYITRLKTTTLIYLENPYYVPFKFIKIVILGHLITEKSSNQNAFNRLFFSRRSRQNMSDFIQ